MLGIKRYKDVSLDLWVGAPEDFFCDKAWNSLPETLNLGESPFRHLAFVLDESYDHKKLFSQIKENLEQSSQSEKTKRITFITKFVPHHDTLHEDLGLYFPVPS